MRFALAPEAIAAGYGLAAYETIGSTNTEAMARLRALEPGPLWVVSNRQAEGRGRRGAAWTTEPGDLAASLGLLSQAEPATIATLGFVAGVALVRALDQFCARPADVRLKWPNDVLVGGAKLAGILLETERVGDASVVVIGIGVNVAHAPEGLPYPAASLRSLGDPVTAEELFSALSAEWVRHVRLWDEGRGFGSIRELWLARATGLGGAVSVRSGPAVMSGTFQTIDTHGQLVLRGDDGEVRAISAGDVYFGPAATARQEAAA